MSFNPKDVAEDINRLLQKTGIESWVGAGDAVKLRLAQLLGLEPSRVEEVYVERKGIKTLRNVQHMSQAGRLICKDGVDYLGKILLGMSCLQAADSGFRDVKDPAGAAWAAGDFIVFLAWKDRKLRCATDKGEELAAVLIDDVVLDNKRLMEESGVSSQALLDAVKKLNQRAPSEFISGIVSSRIGSGVARRAEAARLSDLVVA
jgi:hypothetical protein